MSMLCPFVAVQRPQSLNFLRNLIFPSRSLSSSLSKYRMTRTIISLRYRQFTTSLTLHRVFSSQTSALLSAGERFGNALPRNGLSADTEVVDEPPELVRSLNLSVPPNARLLTVQNVATSSYGKDVRFPGHHIAHHHLRSRRKRAHQFPVSAL